MNEHLGQREIAEQSDGDWIVHHLKFRAIFVPLLHT